MLLVAACVVAMGGYSIATAPADEVVIHPGGQLPLGGFNDVVAAFEKKTGIKVRYTEKIGGCGDSVKGVSGGTANLGIMCCPANKDETGKLGFVDSAIARDALEFVVAKSNPVNNLTTQQLRDIYQGKIKNWKEVGGNDAPIVAYSHVMCGNREEVARQYLTGVRENGKITIDNSLFAPWLKNVGDETKVPETVAADPNGIGWVSRSMNKDVVKVLSVDGVLPTPETIANETYPVVRYLHVVTKGYPEGATKQFIDFAKSREGQAILAKQGKIIPLPY
ncbi:MAG: phosphate ABC transporter substrate-binding protein [Desulfobulbaceae bacterium]